MQDHWQIFIDNLNIYHIFFDLIAFFIFFGTVWFCWRTVDSDTNNILNDKVMTTEEEDSNLNADAEEKANLPIADRSVASALVKGSKQQILYRDMYSKLSLSELEEEKRVEMKQLARILELLREHEDKFQVTSMEQVQDQLNLYGI